MTMSDFIGQTGIQIAKNNIYPEAIGIIYELHTIDSVRRYSIDLVGGAIPIYSVEGDGASGLSVKFDTIGA